jgi:hypothetical protein
MIDCDETEMGLPPMYHHIGGKAVTTTTTLVTTAVFLIIMTWTSWKNIRDASAILLGVKHERYV